MASELVSVEPPRMIHALFVQNGDMLHIRKWSVDRPFDGASLYVYAGRGDPLQPGDSSEHYRLDQLPSALRFVATVLPFECEQHVTEDCIRVVADAADALKAQASRIAELENAAVNLAVVSGKLNIALDGEAKYRRHRQAVLEAMKSLSTLLGDREG